MKLIIIIALLGVIVTGQTLKQVSDIKKQYENIVLNDSVVIVSGVPYSIDTMHYNLRYAVIENDYVFFPTGMVSVDEVFLPYMLVENNMTVYQKYLQTGKLLEK